VGDKDRAARPRERKDVEPAHVVREEKGARMRRPLDPHPQTGHSPHEAEEQRRNELAPAERRYDYVNRHADDEAERDTTPPDAAAQSERKQDQSSRSMRTP
jgi:hypothetical protein